MVATRLACLSRKLVSGDADQDLMQQGLEDVIAVVCNLPIFPNGVSIMHWRIRLVRLIGLGLFLALASSNLAATSMPDRAAMASHGFPAIEQPLAVKIAVTLAGAALIGLELWWFLWSKTQTHSTKP
jgi:hypothetical protein